MAKLDTDKGSILKPDAQNAPEILEDIEVPIEIVVTQQLARDLMLRTIQLTAADGEYDPVIAELRTVIAPIATYGWERILNKENTSSRVLNQLK